ncbi:MAG: hypothetical protein ACE144_08495 [Thermodesulfobacteriota bacterium]
MAAKRIRNFFQLFEAMGVLVHDCGFTLPDRYLSPKSVMIFC